jgi:nucleotide-binding universal stress UspA family protein
MLREGVSPQMHKLLVPFDGSNTAMRALEYAIKLAKEHGPMELVIAYAHEPPLIYGEIAVYLPEDKAEELQLKHSEDILRPAIEKAKRAGVPFTTEVLVGDIPESIASRAEALACDGIVMGTRGMSAIGNLVMGSVATKLVHLTKLPVTLVK